MRNNRLTFLLFFVVLVVITLLLFFLNGEKLCIDCKINDAKFNNFFVCVASIITVVSIIFLYNDFLLKKIEKKPILLINQCSFFAKDEFISNPYTRIIKFFPSNSNTSTQISPFIEIINSGFGPAYNIIINWEYDETEIETFIKDYYNPFGYKHKTDSESLIMEKGSLQVKIPGYFLQTVGPALGLDAMDVPEQKRPTLKVRLKYSDVYNRNYKEVFILSSEVFFGNVIINSKTDKA